MRAGWAARVRWQRGRGAFLPLDTALTPEAVAEQWAAVQSFDEPIYPQTPLDSFASGSCHAAGAPGHVNPFRAYMQPEPTNHPP